MKSVTIYLCCSGKKYGQEINGIPERCIQTKKEKIEQFGNNNLLFKIACDMIISTVSIQSVQLQHETASYKIPGDFGELPRLRIWMEVDMMKQKNYRKMSILLCTCLLLLNACGRKQTEPEVTAEDERAFCWAENGQGGSVDAFRSESDGIWYLAVPSSWDLTELDLHFSEKMTETEKGELDHRKTSVSGAFTKSGDRTELKTQDGTVQTLVVLQSDLPSVQVDMNGTSLEEVHADKSQKHRGNTVLITEADGNVAVEALNNTELKGRGNSTWQQYEKKGYQLQFTEETDVLGMGQAEKWVLLSNASDDSMLRTKVAYEAVKQLNMAFVPDFEYVDLWINGEYRGVYMIGEKVELVESRLKLEDPLGTLYERDEAFFKEEDYWIHNDYLETNFVLKENVSDQEKLYRVLLEEFSGKVDQLMNYLYTTPPEEVTLERLSERIDVDSFALYYLVNEYFLNRESVATSFYWYQDGTDDVLHLGPVWDFDTCMGNDGVENTEYYCVNSLLFKYLLASPEFQQRTEELYRENKHAFESLADTAAVLGSRIEQAARANYLRWNVLGSESTKRNGASFAESYSEAVSNLTSWLFGRAKLFEVPSTRVATSTVSDDYGTLYLRYSDDMEHESVRFVCWNRSSEDSKVMWFGGFLVDGVWTAAADLRFFQEKGMYQIGVYSSDSPEALADGVNYVAGAKENPYVVETVQSADMNQVTMTAADPDSRYEYVNFAIWSAVNNQADLQVFSAEKDSDGFWRSTADLSGYDAEGEYHIHAFGHSSAGDELMDAVTIIRYPIWAEGENPYLIDTQVSEDASSVTITVTVPKDDCSLVNFLVWSSAGGQSDLQVFPAEKIGEGLWSYTVDLTQYEVEGQYNVHVFGEKPYDYIKLNTATFDVEFSHE